jgi:AcrR family transcriptional regulator
MLVYSRLGGKPGIIDALYIEGFERLAAEMRATRSTADPVADLRRCAARYRKFARENPTYYAVMFERAIADFEPSLAAKAVALGTLDVLADRVQRAIDAERFPRQDARQLAACLWAANHGVVSLELKRVGPPEIDWASRHAQVIDALLAGLGS